MSNVFRRASRHTAPVVERIEPRLLLSGSLVPDLNAPGVTIHGTAGNDTISVSVGPAATLVAQVNGTITSYTPDQYRGGITIDTGSSSGAGDVLNLNGLPAVPSLVQSEGPLSVTVGSDSRGMQDVAATTLAIGAASSTQGRISLKLNDASDPTGRTVTLDTISFGNQPYGAVTGMSAGLVEFNAGAAASPVILNASNGGNTITVHHTPAGPNINLNTGIGNDTVNVLGTAAGTVLNVNGVAGKDKVTIDVIDQNSNIPILFGVVNVSNPLGQTDLTIDDSIDLTLHRNMTLDTFAAPGGTYGTLQGLAPAPINFASLGLHSVTIDVGYTYPSPLTIKNTPGGGPITINEPFGNITVLGVAAGQKLNIFSEDGGAITFDFSTGRIAGGSDIVAVTENLIVSGGSATDPFVLDGGQLTHGTTLIDGIGGFFNEFDFTRGSLAVAADEGSAGGIWILAVSGPDASVSFPSSVTLDQIDLSVTDGARATILNGSKITVGGDLALDGRLDVGTGSISFEGVGINPQSGAAETIRNWIASGLAGGRGITTSAADANHTVGLSTSGPFLVKYARYGDANLDGKVDFKDLVLLAQNYGKTGGFWQDGDFNYDGKVGFDDLVKLAQNYGKR